ncbi:probable protein phosphatase 2C 80 [Lycium barbarum]|uniref:probable protein phosphatase 2C 80 n=1 Tax=Lycium barbarum TaxID=112863 RepID=UPI00293E3430|nr:probable protein phosphatase 2C 80 [Lycium barbarum]
MKVLKEAFVNTKAMSSSTACILTLSDDTLHAVNIGDTAFVVIRDGVIVYKSEIQQLRFNCPFQLGKAKTSDDPSVAKKILFRVDSWETDVPETLAWRIVQYALDNSKSTELYTPFARECFKAGLEHSGGKIDNITVIVANIWSL